MPLYTFSCGSHKEEHVVPVGTQTVSCSCGGQSVRVFSMGAAIRHKNASEFVLSPDIRKDMDDATGYKREAIAAKREAEMNGFTVR